MAEVEIDLRALHLKLPARLPRRIAKDGPVPLLIRVARKNDRPNAYYAPGDRSAHLTPEHAEAAEASHKRYLFSQTQEGLQESRQRSVAKRLVSATIIPAADYDGWVADDEDYFASDTSEFREHFEGEECPSYCFATKTVEFDFDLDDCITSYCDDNHHEDAADSLDMKPLLDFFNEWKAKQSLVSYEVDWKRVVVLDPARFEIELAAARALLAPPDDRADDSRQAA